MPTKSIGTFRRFLIKGRFAYIQKHNGMTYIISVSRLRERIKEGSI